MSQVISVKSMFRDRTRTFEIDGENGGSATTLIISDPYELGLEFLFPSSSANTRT